MLLKLFVSRLNELFSWFLVAQGTVDSDRVRRRSNAGHRFHAPLESLEGRCLLSATVGEWHPVNDTFPDAAGAQVPILLSNGTVMVRGGGGSTSNAWYSLTPTASGNYESGTWSPLASSGTARLFAPAANLQDGSVLWLGGEYTGPVIAPATSPVATDSNSGEIYDPQADTWTPILNFPQSKFGDDPIEVLNDGSILAGYLQGPQTYIYSPTTHLWNQTGTKLNNDRSDEESWVKLQDGSILSYDIFSSEAATGGLGLAQRFIPSLSSGVQLPDGTVPQGKWVSAGQPPILSNPPPAGQTFGQQADELGGAVLLPDRRAFFLGANGQSAFYTPSTPSTPTTPTTPESWQQGPNLPIYNGQQLGAGDAPMAMLPNGHVLLAASPLVTLAPDPQNPGKMTGQFSGPCRIYEFDPADNSFTDVTPPSLVQNVNNSTYPLNMLVLPNGRVLLTDNSGQLEMYIPEGNPQDAWRPTITSYTSVTPGVFQITGTQLTGISEGSNYGDDNTNATNFPIVRLTDHFHHEYYAHSFNWSSSDVAISNTPMTVRFDLPAGVAPGVYDVSVIANGIASNAVTMDLSSMFVTSNGVAIPDGTRQTSEFNGTDFGDVPFDSSSTHTYVIVNNSASTLTVGSVAVGGSDAGDFQVLTQPSTTVAPGSSTSFTIEFLANEAGERSTEVSFTESDGTQTSPFTFNISGHGQIPQGAVGWYPHMVEIAPNTFQSGDGHSWSDPFNWNHDEVPTAGDIVYLGASTTDMDLSVAVQQVVGPNATVTMKGSLTVDSSASFHSVTFTTGTLNANGLTSIDLVTMDGGALGGSGHVTVNGAMTWLGGTITGGGVLNVTGGLHIRASENGFVPTLSDRTFTIDGASDWTSGSFYMAPSALGGAQLINNGTFDLRGDFPISDLTFIGQFSNHGTLRKSAGNGDAVWLGTAVNLTGGVVDIQTGSIQACGGQISGQNMTVNGAGRLDYASGVTTFVDAASITGGDGTIEVSGGTVSTPAASTAIVTMQHFAMSGGQFDGSGTLTINGAMTWSGGTITGGGVLNVTGGLHIRASENGFVPTLSDRTFTIDGASDWTSGSFYMAPNAPGNAQLINNGTFDLRGDFPISDLTFIGQFSNHGTLRKSAGNGDAVWLGTAVNLTGGVVDIQTGSIQACGGQISGQNMTVNGAGRLDYTSGVTTFVDGASITGGDGTIEVSGGTVSTPAASTVIVTMQHFAMSGGQFDGSGTLTINGAMTWSGGTITGGGVLNVPGGLHIRASENGFVPTLSDRTLMIDGASDWTSGSLYMAPNAPGNAQLINNGTFDLRGDFPISDLTFIGQFTNHGLFRKSGGDSAANWSGTYFANTGMVSLESGALNVNGDYIQTAGTTNLQANTTLDPLGDFLLQGGNLDGNGLIGTRLEVSELGKVRPGGSNTGILTVEGDFIQDRNGTLELDLRGLTPGSQHDQLVVHGIAQLDGTLKLNTGTGFKPPIGASLTVLTYSSQTGMFSSLLGTDAGNNRIYTPVTEETQLRLDTSAGLSGLEANDDDVGNVFENLPLSLSIAGLLANDSAPIVLGVSNFTSFTQPQNGTLVQNPDATLTYQPSHNFTGLDHFTYALTDGQGGSSMAIVTIHVLPVVVLDVAPVFISPAVINVAENQTAVGPVVATDSDIPAQTVTYSITGGVDAARFSISSTGALVFKSAPDFEMPSDLDGNNVYELQVTADDGNTGLTVQNITITVTGVNDNAPVFSSSAAVTVPENTTSVLSVVATDADMPAETIRYSLTGGADASKFSLTNAGVLTFVAAPDFENPSDFDANHVYDLQITADDGAGRTTVQNMTVTVTGLNDNSPSFTSSSNVAIGENQTSVTTVTATDADLPQQTLTYQLSGGADRNLFTITSDGVLRFSTAPDFESPGDSDHNNIYLVQVAASDGSGGTSVQNIAVTVSGLNDNVPVFTSNANVTVAENQTVVATLLATDADLPQQLLTYAITGGADQGKFSITSTGILTFQTAPDFEAPADLNHDNSYLVQVSASDGAGGLIEQDMIVTVSNVNEAPTITSNATLNVSEQTTAVVTLTATDPELQEITYTISGGADAAALTINSVTGALSFITAPKFSAPTDVGHDNIYNVTVKATDSGTPNQSTFQNLSIHVTQVAGPPVISGGSGSVTFLKKHAAVKLMPNILIDAPKGDTSLGKLVISYVVPKGGLASDVSISNPSELGSIVSSIPSAKKSAVTATLTITLDDGTTVAQVEDFLRSISFKTTKFDSAHKQLGRKIEIQVFDRQGAGAASNKVTTTILAHTK
jgi:VCBS repeat-containing protein